jgi:hypothetical protein
MTHFLHLRSSVAALIACSFAVLSGCHSTPTAISVAQPASLPAQTASVQERFNGPGGADVHNFVNATNACKRELAGMTYLGNGAVLPTCDSIIGCLAAKGYVTSPSGKFDAEELRIGLPCTVK